jgi:hypothetical protein
VALALLGPAPARALFGAGDIVFDPANVAQTINVLHAAQQQIDSLGSLLGVSTRQFDQLVSLAVAIGNAGESAAFGAGLSPAQLEQLVRGVPGLENADLGALFNTNSQIDAFLGVPLSVWAQAIENPDAFYGANLVDASIARVGASEGLSSPAIAYAQWYASLAAADRQNLGALAAADIAGTLADGWLQGATQRRVNLQALSAASQAEGDRARQAQTLADQQHTQAQIGSLTNQILVESAAQAADAREAIARSEGAQSQLLLQADETRRNDAEMRLDAAP